jgi:hypothetical protein
MKRRAVSPSPRGGGSRRRRGMGCFPSLRGAPHPGRLRRPTLPLKGRVERAHMPRAARSYALPAFLPCCAAVIHSLERRAPMPPPPFPARAMGGPERRGAVSSRGRGKKRRSRSVPDHGRLSVRRLRGQGVFPLRVHGPRATLGNSARSLPRSREASARRKTGAGGVASRGFGRGSPPIPANRAPPAPPDPREAPHAAEAGRNVGIKSGFVKSNRLEMTGALPYISQSDGRAGQCRENVAERPELRRGSPPRP